MFNLFKKSKINKEEALELLKQKNSKLVDVREISEHRVYHINNSINYPLSKLQNFENIDKVLPDKTTNIILYCASGGRSNLALKLLKHKGYENVYDFGGINNWQ
ncbi:MAG: rhodanese-like domain-containing protein [Filifactoraceae bacterium]